MGRACASRFAVVILCQPVEAIPPVPARDEPRHGIRARHLSEADRRLARVIHGGRVKSLQRRVNGAPAPLAHVGCVQVESPSLADRCAALLSSADLMRSVGKGEPTSSCW